MERRQFRRIGFIAGKVLVEIIRGIVLQNPAGFPHDFHCVQAAFQRFDRAETKPFRMPGLVQMSMKPGIDVNAFRASEIDGKDGEKLLLSQIL